MVGVMNPLSPLEAGVTPPTPMVLIPRTKNVRLLRYLRIFAYSSLYVLAKSGCFKCGEEGHRKSDCPQAGDGDDEAREKKCFKCGGDHFARECEKPDVCRMCGEEGHMSKDCSGAKTHSITKEDGT